MDLSGDWGFKIDSTDKGIKEKWFNSNLSGTVTLPASMAENGKGNDIKVNTHWTGNMWNDSLWYKDPEMKKYRQNGNVKVPFWLTPVKEYKGAAWYQKTVVIPESWSDKSINLYLERVHWESTVWVDGKKIGMQNSLATPHNYNLNNVLTTGEHTISIRVDNRVKDINVGLDAHSISDNTQTNWNGIVGDIYLSATSKMAIGNVKLSPDVSNKFVKTIIQIENILEKNQKGELIIEVAEKSASGTKLKTLKRNIDSSDSNEIVVKYNMGNNPKLWDEFNPNLYQMQITLKSDLGTDTKQIDFGMRDFKAKGTVFTVNERPVFLRGTLECAIFPLTGYPPTDVGSWKRIFKIIKNHGLNHMRFHSWCPPEAAFKAADEMGVYLQVEASAWATIGDGAPVDKWLYKEAEAIIDNYGNHPSFVMMAYGNEPHGENHKAYLREFINYFKSYDNRRLYTSAAGWPYLDNMDYYNNSKPRIQGWNQNLNSIINSKPPQTVFDYSDIIEKTPMPYVSHETGQWCVFPNFKEMSKYTGVLKPKNFEIFKESLEHNNLGHLADSLLLASGKLQTLCYKADIEAALRTKDFAGFQLLDLHDFPGQGTALVGVLDAFWDEKGYVSPEAFSRFCNETVPLARLEKRIFRSTDTLRASVEVAHYGEKPLKKVSSKWVLSSTDSIINEGTFKTLDISIGNGIDLGEITVPLKDIKTPQKLTLSVEVSNFENSWDVWVYPNKQDKIKNEETVKVIDKLDEAAIAYLKKGGNLLLNITKGDIVSKKGGDIGVGFSSIFWNTSWTKGQKPHTLGILCNPEHPALAKFPTEYHSNWQWWDAMSNSNAIILDDLPKDLKPIVRIVDDWFENRKTALIFEARVGNGKLLFSSIDLHTNIKERLEAQQLLYSLKNYMASDAFNPKTVLDIKQIKAFLNYK
ncbi:glycosyl hydrolase family 2 [Jejuia pallidilutea]|uniref:Glycosyl hydrolase family 2 n=1 Tax=Jejuia pallidilutea TaxID=504487 RepID=A0A362X8Z3_9FLAO|nr:sugar-binding domain-containing protein [Jejuia pallidilutea]PQV48230.1 glycosyl hydrolase family 2 [Jejuia pallidilutea]